MTKVVLFRSPTPPPKEDEYHQVFLDKGFTPFSIPVLSFKFDNQQELVQKLKEPCKYEGMVLTSQRAVEAIEHCVSDFIRQEVWRSKIASVWGEKVVFVVGKATGKAASEKLGLESIGNEAGSADALVPVILQWITLDGIQVYSTCADPAIRQSLADFMREKGAPSYAVFFSPSGVNFTEEILSSLSEWWSSVKLVAIGKTTAEAMKSKGWIVTAVADQPNPQALAQCITDDRKGDN